MTISSNGRDANVIKSIGALAAIKACNVAAQAAPVRILEMQPPSKLSELRLKPSHPYRISSVPRLSSTSRRALYFWVANHNHLQLENL